MKCLVGLILIGIGVYLFYIIRYGGLPDIPESDCLYETHGFDKCDCWDCIKRKSGHIEPENPWPKI